MKLVSRKKNCFVHTIGAGAVVKPILFYKEYVEILYKYIFINISMFILGNGYFLDDPPIL